MKRFFSIFIVVIKGISNSKFQIPFYNKLTINSLEFQIWHFKFGIFQIPFYNKLIINSLQKGIWKILNFKFQIPFYNKLTINSLGFDIWHLTFGIFLVFLMGCGKTHLQDYYFPLNSLREQPKVYEYQLITPDTTLTIYWYYQTIVQGDSINFVGTCYDGNFQILQISREEQVSNGMKLKDLSFYGTKTDGTSVKMSATIEGGAIFPFEVTDDKSVFVNVIRYADPKDSTHITTLTRNRRFLKKINYNYKGHNLDAAQLSMKEEQSEHNLQLGGLTHVYEVEEIYARTIGLVYTKRTLEGGKFFETKLVDIITMQELEARFKQDLDKK